MTRLPQFKGAPVKVTRKAEGKQFESNDSWVRAIALRGMYESFELNYAGMQIAADADPPLLIVSRGLCVSSDPEYNI